MDIKDIVDKRIITIKNPEKLNVHTTSHSDEWVIEYMGRDLSLSEDNYRWDVHSNKSTQRGYYIIEREIQHHNWLWVRWGLTTTNVKGRPREHIDKKRVRDRDTIQSDMIQAINSLG